MRYLLFLVLTGLFAAGPANPNSSKSKVKKTTSSQSTLVEPTVSPTIVQTVDSQVVKRDDFKKLQEQVELLKANKDSAESTIGVASLITSLSGWIGLLVTVIIFGFTFISFNRARELENNAKEKIERAIAEYKKVTELASNAQKMFKDFINSPKAIQNAIESMHADEVHRLLKSEDLESIQEALSFVYQIRNVETRRNIATSIKQFLFPPFAPNTMQFAGIFQFLKSSLKDDFARVAIQLFEHSKHNIPVGYLGWVVASIYAIKPYALTVSSMVELIGKGELATVIPHLGQIPTFSELDYEDLLRACIRHGHFDALIAFKQYISKDRFTNIIEENIGEIPDEYISAISSILGPSKVIIKSRLTTLVQLTKPFFSDTYLLSLSTSGIDGFKLICKCIDNSIEDHWKGMFQLSQFCSDFQDDAIKAIQAQFLSIESLPTNNFYHSILPELFKPNYGLTLVGSQVFFNGSLVESIQTTSILGGLVYPAVKHPVLNIDIKIENLTRKL